MERGGLDWQRKSRVIAENRAGLAIQFTAAKRKKKRSQFHLGHYKNRVLLDKLAFFEGLFGGETEISDRYADSVVEKLN